MSFSLIVNRGLNLPSADTNGLSDPYVIVELLKVTRKSETDTEAQVDTEVQVESVQKVKSPTVKKSLNPVWANTQLVIEDIANTSGFYVRFSVFDWDALSPDDPLGFCILDLESYLQKSHANREHWQTYLQLIDGKAPVKDFTEIAIDFGHEPSQGPPPHSPLLGITFSTGKASDASLPAGSKRLDNQKEHVKLPEAVGGGTGGKKKHRKNSKVSPLQAQTGSGKVTLPPGVGSKKVSKS